MAGDRKRAGETAPSLLEKMGNTLGKSGECRGVMLEFEDAYPQKFAQLVTNAPQWTEWMDGVRKLGTESDR